MNALRADSTVMTARALLITALLWLFMVSAIVPSAAAQAVTMTGASNIYGAGHVSAPGPGGSGGGALPEMVAVPAGTGRTAIFSLSGTTDFGPCCPSNGPDGNVASGASPLPLYGGLAGCDLATRGRYITGVFIDDNEPVDPAPSRLVFASVTFTELSPALRQIFFVGDGLTGEGTGTTQVFHVPDGATRLYLGVQDRCSGPNVPGWYGDNTGTVSGTVTFDIPTGIGDEVPSVTRLAQNFPNPFSGSTSIALAPDNGAAYDLSVYDVRGRLVRVLGKGVGAGPHSVVWDGTDRNGRRAKSGIYYYRLQSDGVTETRKMVILR